MLIEKRNFSGGINSDLSERLLPDTDCLNIMNSRFGVTKYGRFGRIENVPGTLLIPQTVYPPYGSSQTIGSAIDWEEMRLLYFNYNDFQDHGIYCFDPAANSGAGQIYAVLYDSQVIGGLGFSKNSLIHSARVQNGCLYWVDGTNNEPRRININAGIEMNHPGTFPDVVRYEYPMTQSVIRWIRRQPGLPLTATKHEDVSYQNNFIKNEAFLFQWRYIYRDYETSTLSAFSLLQNYNQASQDENYIRIVAPLDEQIDQDVIQVDFVAKYLNSAKSFVIHSWNRSVAADLAEIEAHNAGTTPLTFDFYNDITGIALDDAYSVKPFDSFPIYANTMEMARFRSFVANYIIGYDTPISDIIFTASGIQGDSTTTYGQWIVIKWGYDGTNSNYFIQIDGEGYFGVTPQPTPPPYPTTVDYVTELIHVADTPEEFAGYCQDHFLFWYNGIEYAGSTATVTNAPSPPSLSGQTAFKSGASYQLSISYLDHAGRKCGIVTTQDLKINIPDREYDQVSYTTAINWSLSNFNALNEIPDWAYYYSINITKCLSTRYFLQSKARNITYVTKDTDGLYVYNTSAYAANLYGIGIDITMLNSYGMGYVFAEGDLIKIYIDSDPNVYTLSIIAQDGDWLVCELQDLGTLGEISTPKTDVLFQIYTPYKPSTSEPYFENAQIFPVNFPTTVNRAYSTLAGQFRGDITLLTRNDGTDDYLTENMSPNDKYYQIWNTDAGRPNFIDTIGQVVKESSIAYSNTFIPGTKVNGLSTYDALDTKDIQCGTISKLQVANKTGEDEGDLMLSICENETASLYLGEVQLVGQASNAFIAQAPSVIGTVNVLKGSLGTTRPESVSCYQGLVFGIDLNKGIVWQYSPAGLEEVSRYKMKRFFKNYCDAYLTSNANNLDNINGFHHIRGSINPFHKEAQFILPALIYENYAEVLPSYAGSVPVYASSIINRFDVFDELQKTMNFCYEENRWGSNFQWIAEWQDFLQNESYGFKNGNLYKFDADTENWNTVFGVEYPLRICTSGNINPSLMKSLFNVAIEGDGTIPNFVVAMTNYPNLQITDLADSDTDIWTVNESVVEAEFLCDRLSPNSSSSTADEKLYNGDQLLDFCIFLMLEYQVYDRLMFVQFVNIGYNYSRGQLNIVNVVNK